MNREDIIRMAREAGFDYSGAELTWESVICTEELERFATLVVSHALVEPCCGNYDKCQKVCMPRAASAEREAFAKICDEFCYGSTKILVERAIRARGQA